jgi:hypothetical protein
MEHALLDDSDVVVMPKNGFGQSCTNVELFFVSHVRK